MSREELLSLRNTFIDEFRAVENDYFDKLEELCRLSALGELPEGYEDFNFNQAKILLERRRSDTWIPTKKTQVVREELKSNGIGEQKTDEYLKRLERAGTATVRPGSLPQ